MGRRSTGRPTIESRYDWRQAIEPWRQLGRLGLTVFRWAIAASALRMAPTASGVIRLGPPTCPPTSFEQSSLLRCWTANVSAWRSKRREIQPKIVSASPSSLATTTACSHIGHAIPTANHLSGTSTPRITSAIVAMRQITSHGR